MVENKINRIITEAINNAVVFGKLKNHASDLEYYLNTLKNNNNSNQFNGEIIQFNKELIAFTETLVAAINRCIQAQNLNESSSGWLSNIPSLNNALNATINGYKSNSSAFGSAVASYKNFKNNISGRNNDYSATRGNRGNNNVPQQNTKLQVILTQYFPLLQQKYVKLNVKYNNALENMNPPTAKYILNEVEEVIYTIKNAQGNP